MNVISRKESKSLGLKRYFTGKPCKYDHIAERAASNGMCVECSRIKAKREYDDRAEYLRAKRKEYYYENQDIEKEKSRKYYLDNRDSALECARLYRVKNRDRIIAASRIYRENNRERMIELQKIWRDKNPDNAQVRRSLYRIEDGINLEKHELIIGYTRGEFIDHIQSLFKDGMCWANRGEWHIDHIKPVSAFIKEGVTDPKIVNALSNLQPLWAEDNIRKGSTRQE